MKFTAQQIATQLNGTVEGDTSTEVSELSKIEDAASGSLTFLSNPKYAPYIYKTKASIVIVHQDFKPERPLESTLIRVKDPYSAFSDLLDFYNKAAHNRTGIAAGAFVHKSATLGQHCYVGHNSVVEQNAVIGDNVKIYPQVFIGENVKIGKDCIIYPGTQILAGTLIGSDCIIHSGTVIGSDGFGFAPQEDGSYKKIPQTGIVIIEDGVEIGANATIDRATLGATLLRKGVKLDNQIQIAHNVEVGEHTVIAAQSGIAGSTKIGTHCVIGGQVGIIGHLTIGDHVKMQGQSGVISSIPDHAKIQGTPAFDYTSYSKSYVHFRNLPKLIKKLDKND